MSQGGISATLEDCPLCGSKVKTENLNQHFTRVHPGKSAALKILAGTKDKKSNSPLGTHVKIKRLSTGAKRVIAIALVIAVVSGAYFAYDFLRPKPHLYADHNFYALGDVPQTKVSHMFTFSNTGEADLTIFRIWTSCGCTTAKIELNGISSPEFGMPGHGGYSGSWSEDVKPGETVKLTVYYDSTEMPNLYEGERYVFIDSNDPVTPEYQFTINVREVP